MARQRPLREVCNARADTPRLPAFACNWYREYEAARGEHASLASTVARRKVHPVLSRPLLYARFLRQ